MKKSLILLTGLLLLAIPSFAQEETTFRHNIGINMISLLNEQGGTELQYSYANAKTELRLSGAFGTFDITPSITPATRNYSGSEGKNYNIRTGIARLWQKDKIGFALGSDARLTYNFYSTEVTDPFRTRKSSTENKYKSIEPFLGLSYHPTDRFSLRFESFAQFRQHTFTFESDNGTDIRSTESVRWESRFFRDFRLFARLHF